MRWGNINELIIEDAKIFSEKINKAITNKNKDINYIDGADHGYHGKERTTCKSNQDVFGDTSRKQLKGVFGDTFQKYPKDAYVTCPQKHHMT